MTETELVERVEHLGRDNQRIKELGAVALIVSAVLCCACNSIGFPEHRTNAPKVIVADGVQYTACVGAIDVYQPSRDISSSSQKTYEITFTDEYGKAEDLRDIKSYTIRNTGQGETLNYAMAPEANPSNMTTTYSNGQTLRAGDVVWFGKNGSDGRAKWFGPGKWQPVRCGD